MGVKKSGGESTLFDYILEHVFYVIPAFIGYYMTMFRCVGSYGLSKSRMILIVIILVCVPVGIMVSKYLHEMDSTLSVIRNLGFPFVLYTMISYWTDKKLFFWIWLGVLALLLIGYVIRMHGILKLSADPKEHKKRIDQFYRGGSVLFSVGVIAFVGIMYLQLLLGNTVLKPTIAAEKTGVSTYEEMFEKNRTVLEQLDEERWKDLSPQERLNVLAVISDLECVYLGIDEKIPIESKELDERTLATFNQKKRVIQIGDLTERSAEQALNSVLHEVYHYYEDLLCVAYSDTRDSLKNLLIFREAKAADYSREFDSYVDGSGGSNYNEYANQQLEISAREWAENRATAILCKLHLQGADRQMKVVYDEDSDGRARLYSKDGKMVAEHDYIEDEPYTRSGIRRYKDGDRLGFLGPYGEELTEAKFLEASSFGEGDWALVRENLNSVYYIDERGKRVTKDYVYGYEPVYNGMFAIVEEEDGTLSMINRNDEVVFNATSFDTVPISGRTMGAVKDGHAVLLRLTTDGDFGRVEVINELEEYSSIKVYWNFAIVTNQEGLFGVIDLDGECIIESKYDKIEYFRLNGDRNNKTKTMICFRLRKNGKNACVQIEFP